MRRYRKSVDARIGMGNGIEVGVNGAVYHMDPSRLSGHCCISHAHSDHLPQRGEVGDAMCSPLTLTCANARLGRDRVSSVEHEDVTMLPSGHIMGSTMFQVESVLYTGDLSVRDRLGIEGARPLQCSTLIMEATFGRPRYIMPPTDDVISALRDWVEDSMARGHPVFIYAYSLGKAQEMVRLLADMRPCLHGPTLKMTEIVSPYYPGLHWQEYSDDMEPPFVMVYSPPRQGSAIMSRWRKRGAKTAAVSGWAIDPGRKYMMRVDEAFPLSDHADFEELIGFARDCQAERVFLHHGHTDILAKELRQRLGVEAIPLREDVCNLLQF